MKSKKFPPLWRDFFFFSWYSFCDTMIKAVIFDFDGTLVDSLQVILDAYNEVAPLYGGKIVSKHDVLYLRQQDVRAIRTWTGLTGLQFLRVFFAVRRKLRERMGEVQWHGGMWEVLRELRGQGMILGILTSNARVNALAFLERFTATDLFSFVTSLHGFFGKERTLEGILKKYDLQPDELIYVGDELRDVAAAKAAGVKSVAVTWGVHPRTLLLSAQPDFLVDTPEELLRLCTRGEF